MSCAVRTWDKGRAELQNLTGHVHGPKRKLSEVIITHSSDFTTGKLKKQVGKTDLEVIATRSSVARCQRRA